jgi:hypothetical protein
MNRYVNPILACCAVALLSVGILKPRARESAVFLLVSMLTCLLTFAAPPTRLAHGLDDATAALAQCTILTPDSRPADLSHRANAAAC